MAVGWSTEGRSADSREHMSQIALRNHVACALAQVYLHHPPLCPR